MKIEITSATLKGRYSLDYAYKQVDESETNVIKVSCDAPIHEDLRKAFSGLIPHLAFICEEANDKDVKSLIKKGIPEYEDGENPDPILLKYQVNTFKLFGTSGESVQVIGTKLLDMGETISIATPKIKLIETKYKYIAELSQCIEECKIEVNEYLNGKHDPNRQTDMFYELEVKEEE